MLVIFIQFASILASNLARSILGAGESSTDAHQSLQAPALSSAPIESTRSRYYSNTFETVYYDVVCVSTKEPLMSGPVQNLSQCKQRCAMDPSCGYFAYWRTKAQFCITYVDCEQQTNFDQDGAPYEGVQIFKRLTECDVQLVSVDSPYPKLIANAFPNEMIRYKPPNQNIQCICVTGCWGLCGIFVDAGSDQERVARAIINRRDPQPPFRLPPLVDPETAPVTFAKSEKKANYMVYAEIEVLNFDRCIHVSICADGTAGSRCPLSQSLFKSGDAVYILNQDISDVQLRKSVQCFSAMAMRHISMSMSTRSRQKSVSYVPFADPFGRNPEKRMNTNDYSLFFLFDDAALDLGVCSNPIPRGDSGSQSSSRSSSRSGSNSPNKRKGRKKALHAGSPLRFGSNSKSPPIFEDDQSHSLQPSSPQIESPEPETPEDEDALRPGTPELSDPEEYFSRFKRFDISTQTEEGPSHSAISATEKAFPLFQLSFLACLFIFFILLTMIFSHSVTSFSTHNSDRIYVQLHDND